MCAAALLCACVLQRALLCACVLGHCYVHLCSLGSTAERCLLVTRVLRAGVRAAATGEGTGAGGRTRVTEHQAITTRVTEHQAITTRVTEHQTITTTAAVLLDWKSTTTTVDVNDHHSKRQ